MEKHATHAKHGLCPFRTALSAKELEWSTNQRSAVPRERVLWGTSPLLLHGVRVVSTPPRELVASKRRPGQPRSGIIMAEGSEEAARRIVFLPNTVDKMSMRRPEQPLLCKFKWYLLSLRRSTSSEPSSLPAQPLIRGKFDIFSRPKSRGKHVESFHSNHMQYSFIFLQTSEAKT